MPDVHSSALQLLTALIGCARALLVARAADVMRLFVQVGSGHVPRLPPIEDPVPKLSKMAVAAV